MVAEAEKVTAAAAGAEAAKVREGGAAVDAEEKVKAEAEEAG